MEKNHTFLLFQASNQTHTPCSTRRFAAADIIVKLQATLSTHTTMMLKSNLYSRKLIPVEIQEVSLLGGLPMITQSIILTKVRVLSFYHRFQ